MVRVPTARTRETIQRPSAGRASAANFRDDSLSGLQTGLAIASKVGELLKESKKVADKSLTRDRLNSARQELRDFTTDIYSRNAGDSQEALNEVNEKIKEIRLKHTQNVTDPTQNELFVASYDQISNRTLDRTATFETDARLEFEKETLVAANEEFVLDAVANRNDSNEIKESEAGIRQNTIQELGNPGSAITKKAVRDRTHDLYLQVLNAKVDDSPKIAQQYLKDNKDKFNPTAYTKLKVQIDEKVANDEVYTKAGEFSESGLSLEDQLIEVDKTFTDPKQNKQARSLVKQRATEKEATKQAKFNNFVNNQWDGMLQNPLTFEPEINSLPENEQKDMMAYREKAFLQEAGNDFVTDWGLYYDLKTDPEKLKDTELHTLSGKLALNEFKELKRLQQSSSEKQDDLKYTSDARVLRIMKNSLPESLLTIGKRFANKGAIQKRVGALTNLVMKEVKELEDKNKATATIDQIENIVDGYLTKVDPPGFFNTGAFFESEGDAFKVVIDKEDYVDIPEVERNKILRSLNDRNLSTKEKDIQQVFARANLLELRRK